MNEVQLFNFENHEVRSLLINSEPWFVGKDVAEVLGYKKTENAMEMRLLQILALIIKYQNLIFSLRQKPQWDDGLKRRGLNNHAKEL